ncbi:MAG: AAA family ATPase [Verrucomicrobia bacterium]|nr:AAA family ATPase [Verrucomicrobiota bacterium]
MINDKNISSEQIASALKQAKNQIKVEQKAWVKSQAAEREIQSALQTPPPEARSVLSYKAEFPDPEKTLLGDRWLCVGQGALAVGPTGIGKSTSSMQQDICWSIGREAFGIKPRKPLRILVIQAENDSGDLHEMVKGIMLGMGLSEEEERLCGQNLFIACEQERTGLGFIHGVLRPLIEKHLPEIVRIDPLMAFAGCDLTQSAEAAKFLRHGINPILKKFNCAGILVHHTPKNNNRDTSQYRASDWAYAGAGSADIINWARAMLVIDPCKDDGKFCFIAAKRGSRVGWKNDSGDVLIKRWFKHSSGSICWVEADSESPRAVHTEDNLYDLMPFGVCMPKDAFIETAKAVAGIPKSRANSLLSKLLFNGRLVEDKLPRSGTNPQKVIRRPETAPLPNAIVDKTPKKQTKLVRRKAIVVDVTARDSEEASSYIELIEDKAV